MPAPSPPASSWREVKARVHISLPPHALSTHSKTAATQAAFQALLMRYSPSLRGVPVAHRDGLNFSSPAIFIGASPYAHVTATAHLLVFSPPRGAQFVGVVTHIGPDHVGLAVLNAFHAVLPIDPLRESYSYDYRFDGDGLVRRWRCVRPSRVCKADVVLGKRLRFVVEGIEPSHTGLFQIRASLDEAARAGGEGGAPLGVLDDDEQGQGTAEADEDGEVDLLAGGAAEEEPVDVLATSKRSAASSRVRHAGVLGGDPFRGNAFGNALSQIPFGDALTPASTPVAEEGGERGARKKKKHKQGSGSGSRERKRGKETGAKPEKRVVKFEQVEVAGGEVSSQAEGARGVAVLTQTELASQEGGQSPRKRGESKEERRKRREEKRRRKEAKRRSALDAAQFAKIGSQVDLSWGEDRKPGRMSEGGGDASGGRRELGEAGREPKSPQSPSRKAKGAAGGSVGASEESTPAGEARAVAPTDTARGVGSSRKSQMRADALEAVAVGERAETNGAAQMMAKEEVGIVGEMREEAEPRPEPVSSPDSGKSGKAKKRKKRKREAGATAATDAKAAVSEAGTGRKKKKRQKVKHEGKE